MSEYLVNIKNERLSFFTPAGEVKALNDVSLHLKEGEVLGIVGESGWKVCNSVQPHGTDGLSGTSDRRKHRV